MTSRVFSLAAEAVRRQAQREFERTPVGQLTRELSKLRTLERPRRHAANVKDFLSTKRAQKQIAEFARLGSVEKYSLDAASKAALDAFLAQMGPFGTILRGLLNSNTQTMNKDQLAAAEALIRAYGGEVVWPSGHPRRDQQRNAEIAEQLLVEAGVIPPPETTSKGKTGAQRLEELKERTADAAVKFEDDTEFGGRRFMEPPGAEGREPTLSEEKLTPQSSNVYSFQYDYATSTLYVRFKAPQINPDAVRNVRGKGGITGIKGKPGKTVIGRTNDPGPLYAYYDVPVRVFKRLVTASSAGGAVWTELRVRGSLWGHRYRYSLVQGAVVPGQDGRMATYVPRRQTRRGLRGRAVPAAGRGKRQFVTSSLPQDLDRGEPDRGRVSGEWRPYRGR